MPWLRRLSLWLLTLLLWSPSLAQGQVLIALLFGEKLSNERFQLGVNASFAGSGFRGIDDRIRIGWSLSVYGEIALHKRFHLQPELALKYPAGAQGMATSVPAYPFEPYGEPTLDEVVNQGKVRREMRYLALPIYGRVPLGPVGIGVGPQLSVLINAHDVVSLKDQGTRISLKRAVSDDMRRVDFGFAMSIDYAFLPDKGMRSLRLRGSGYVGLVDTVRHNPQAAIRNWNIMLGLDIPIGGPAPKKGSAASPAPAPS